MIYLIEVLIESSAVQPLHGLPPYSLLRELVPALREVDSATEVHHGDLVVAVVLLPVGAKRTNKLLDRPLEVYVS